MNRQAPSSQAASRPEAPACSGLGAGLGAVGLATSPPSEGCLRLRHIARTAPRSLPDRGPHGASSLLLTGLGFSVVHVHARVQRNRRCSLLGGQAGSILPGTLGTSGVSRAQVAGKARLWLSEGAGCTSHAREDAPLGHLR